MTKDRADRSDVPGLEGTPYRFVREIGRGGMGSVHEVEHRALGKVFVMKVLHESLAHREDFALRMKREWRTLARLQHPAIVQVTDAGRTGEGLPFFVMERLDGQTLAEALHAAGRWAPGDAAEMMLVVLSGLEAAHRAGAIHRDIKPQNLFLTPRGPKILDFGIAKSKRKGALLVTRSGVAIGTPRYMAPEQAAGLPVDARADVYACGLVLFEMIAGRDPFHSWKEPAALVNAHINETPPRLDDVRPDVPAALGDVLARWLAKEPADRPASARLAQVELEALLPLLPRSTRSPGEHSTAEISWSQREDESTAGSTSVPPSSSLAEVSLLGVSDTVTLEEAPPIAAAWGPGSSKAEVLLKLDRLDDAPKSPSVTPPPVAARAARARPRASRWGLAAAGLLSAVVLGLGTLVLAPDFPEGLSRGSAGRPHAPHSYEFPETPAAPSPEAPPAAADSSGAVPVASPPLEVRASSPATGSEEAAHSNPSGKQAARLRSQEGPQGTALAAPSGETGGLRSPERSALPPERPAAAASPPSASAASEGAPAPAAPADMPGSGLW